MDSNAVLFYKDISHGSVITGIYIAQITTKKLVQMRIFYI